jgi:hypothetical protein
MVDKKRDENGERDYPVDFLSQALNFLLRAILVRTENTPIGIYHVSRISFSDNKGKKKMG